MPSNQMFQKIKKTKNFLTSWRSVESCKEQEESVWDESWFDFFRAEKFDASLRLELGVLLKLVFLFRGLAVGILLQK